MQLIIPDNMMTFAERLEFVEAAREALRLRHNSMAKAIDAPRAPQCWNQWLADWWVPRSIAVSHARIELMAGCEEPRDADGMPIDHEAHEIKNRVREFGSAHPLVDKFLTLGFPFDADAAPDSAARSLPY